MGMEQMAEIDPTTEALLSWLSLGGGDSVPLTMEKKSAPRKIRQSSDNDG